MENATKATGGDNDLMVDVENAMKNPGLYMNELLGGMMTPLMLACNRNHMGVVKRLVKAGASLDVRNPKGRTALMVASQEEHVEVAEYLLQAGASLELEDSSGVSALGFAANKGNCELVEAFLKAGANVKSRQGSSAVHGAAASGKVDVFALLVRAGAETNTPLVGTFPLDTASVLGHYDLVEWMLSHVGIAHCGGDSGGAKAFLLATSTNHVDIMQLLIDVGKYDGEVLGFALLNAVVGFYEHAVECLLQRGDDVEYLELALMYAVRGYKKHGFASSRLVRRLMDAGAQPTKMMHDEKTWTTVLDTIVKMKEKETEEKHLQRLNAVYHLLLQEDAVHSLSFLWPSLSSPAATPAATPAKPAPPPAQPVVVRPVRKSGEASSRVVLLELFRYARKVDLSVRNA